MFNSHNGTSSFLTDKAREEILEAGGVEKILNKLKELQNEEAKHNYETGHHVTACGAVLNLSFDNGNYLYIVHLERLSAWLFHLSVVFIVKMN